MVPRRKLYVRATIDRVDPGVDFQTYEIPETKACNTRLLLYLSLGGFICGLSLLHPWVAYAGENDKNSVSANSGRHKGRFASKRYFSVLKNLAKASEEKSREQKNDTEEEDIEPPRKIMTKSQQILVKHLLKDKHPALHLSESASCKSNQSELYSHLFEKEFEAHNALEDVKALREILFNSALQLNQEKIVNCSGVISVEHAIASMSYLDRRHEILQTFSGRLFDPKDDNGAIKQSMAQKIAGSGLFYSHLKELYLKFGTKGLLAILSMPHKSTATKPRVTRTKRILDAIAKHFQETFPREE
ncbi:hypothetical protein ACROYT_G032430 [Oculina patagonica]